MDIGLLFPIPYSLLQLEHEIRVVRSDVNACPFPDDVAWTGLHRKRLAYFTRSFIKQVQEIFLCSETVPADQDVSGKFEIRCI